MVLAPKTMVLPKYGLFRRTHGPPNDVDYSIKNGFSIILQYLLNEESICDFSNGIPTCHVFDIDS